MRKVAPKIISKDGGPFMILIH